MRSFWSNGGLGTCNRTKASPLVQHASLRIGPCVDAFFCLFLKEFCHDRFFKPNLSRRAVLQSAAVGAIGINPALRAAVYAAGSDAPEKTEVKIGFIPLTDCASVVMASVLGIDKNTASRSSHQRGRWAGVRDKLVTGEPGLCPRALWFDLRRASGCGRCQKRHGGADEPEPKRPSHHLSKKLADKGAVDGAGLAKLMKAENANTPSPRPSPAPTRCGCTGWRPTVSILCRMPKSSPCHHRRWLPTCASATWTATAWAS